MAVILSVERHALRDRVQGAFRDLSLSYLNCCNSSPDLCPIWPDLRLTSWLLRCMLWCFAEQARGGRMYESTQDAAWVHGIDLAQEPDFDLGSLRVRPARCEVESAGVSKTLQRRVMQVLVALAQARGSVVSQGDLVVRCWRGLSVSDDAIYRCISKLRKLAAEYPEQPYAIEAVPGVGYRLTSPGLVETRKAVELQPQRDRGTRRRLIAAAAAIAILILAAATIWIVRGRPSGDHHSMRVVVQPFNALTNSVDARALAQRIPNEIVNQFGDTQIVTALASEQTGTAPGAKPGLVVSGLVRDD